MEDFPSFYKAIATLSKEEVEQSEEKTTEATGSGRCRPSSIGFGIRRRSMPCSLTTIIQIRKKKQYKIFQVLKSSRGLEELETKEIF